MTDATDPTPVHEPERGRWIVALEGQLAHLDYSIASGVVTIHHTIVPEALGGRGIAARLVRAALDYVRREGLKVQPDCAYAAAWMLKHPEYEDLRRD
ncbi:MAG: N-acetyltransferase [Pseudomonadota bacterium]|nr:N-acetyltransferase [Pseudomonadota bacterium]